MRSIGGDGGRTKFLERDRVAAYMVRAAASGAFNYAKADPSNPQWRLRHLLVLREIARKTDAELLTEVHAHWLAYVSHSQLDADSWANVKKHAADTLESLSKISFPWAGFNEKKPETDTIDNKYGDLIAQYRRMVEGKKAEKPAQENRDNAGTQ